MQDYRIKKDTHLLSGDIRYTIQVWCKPQKIRRLFGLLPDKVIKGYWADIRINPDDPLSEHDMWFTTLKSAEKYVRQLRKLTRNLPRYYYVDEDKMWEDNPPTYEAVGSVSKG